MSVQLGELLEKDGYQYQISRRKSGGHDPFRGILYENGEEHEIIGSTAKAVQIAILEKIEALTGPKVYDIQASARKYGFWVVIIKDGLQRHAPWKGTMGRIGDDEEDYTFRNRSPAEVKVMIENKFKDFDKSAGSHDD